MRTVCVITKDEVVPFWGIVTFNEQETTAKAAIKQEFKKRDPKEDAEDWYGCIEELIYIPVVVGFKLQKMDWPENCGWESTIASHHEMMICICKAFAEEEE